MQIACESSLKTLVSEESDKIVEEPERLLKEQKNASSTTEGNCSSNQTKKEPSSPTPKTKPQPKVCKAPSWKKWGYYGPKYLGVDGAQSFPKRCHTHTIIFLPGFTCDGKLMSHAFKWLSQHARIVSPSAPLRPRHELGGWVQWFHRKKTIRNKHYVHSWSTPKNPVESNKKQIRRIWELIDREAKACGGDYKRIFLVGYSQGADLAIQTGVSFNKRLGGIVALQNWAWGPALMGMNSANKHTPIIAILGAKDQTIKLNDAKSRANDPFWQSNKKKHVRIEVWKHLGHSFYNHHLIRRVNRWINHRVNSKWKN